MKRIKILIISILAFVILVSTVIYSVEKRKYINRKVLLEAQFGFPILSEMCDDVFHRTKNYPESMDEIVSYFREDGDDEEELDEVFVDPFKRNLGYYTYVPLYNRKNLNREGYILLSAGIDGKVNNRFKDTVFIDEDILLKLYGEADTSFNIFRKWFGKKDQLIFRKNGLELLIEESGYPVLPAKSTNEVIELGLRIKKLRTFVMNEYMGPYVIPYKGKIIRKDSSSVYFKSINLWIINQAYESDGYLNYNVGDTIELVGTLTGWTNDTLINITNCIPVENSVLSSK